MHAYRLSPEQALLWRRDGHTAAQGTQAIVRIDGPFEAGQLRVAAAAAAASHQILRARFTLPAGFTAPVQTAEAAVVVSHHVIDLQRLHARSRGAVLARIAQRVRWKTGHASDTWGLSTCCVRTGAAETFLLLTVSPWRADSTSLDLLTDDIVNQMADSGSTVEQTEYLQYSAWANDCLDDPAGERHRARWQRLLEEMSPVPRLLLERATDGPASTPQIATRRLPHACMETVRDAAARCGVTTPAFLLACWQALIGRLSGATDVVVALLLNGRTFAELERMVGPATRGVPVAARVNPELRVGELVAQVASDMHHAEEWQSHWDGSRAGARGPEFAFAYEAARAERSFGGVRFSVVERWVDARSFRWLLVCRADEAGRAELTLNFDAAVASADAADAMLEQLEALVESAALDSESRLDQVSGLGAAMRRRLVDRFNATTALFRGGTLLDRFATTAREAPDAIAVVSGDTQITRAVFDQRTNQLARALQHRGAGPDAAVPVCLDRNDVAILAMVAVLKTGAAYVPIDPALPKSRIASALRISAGPVVIADAGTADLLPRDTDVLLLDRDRAEIEAFSRARPSPPVHPENLAYVLFTSGSTGQPKGVAVEHRQIVNYVEAIRRTCDLRSHRSFAVASTLAADLGHTMVFPSLCAGGVLHLVPHTDTLDPEAFAEYIQSRRIDYLKIVPSHLETLTAAGGGALPSERLILGGEASSTRWVAALQRANPGCAIHNHYGPTETTVGVLSHACDRLVDDTLAPTLPLGSPLANTTAYVVDALMQPQPSGVRGELLIAGAGVARGYWNDPAATAEKFLPNAFASQPGARAYRTGDEAYFSADALYCSGRLDRQVKFHGYRLELDDVGLLLQQEPGIQRGLARLEKDERGQAHLVAYYVSPRPVDHAQLRAHLHEALPAPVVPNHFVHLQRLPLTLNGKIDWAALPSYRTAEAQRSLDAATTPTEELIAEIWRSVLNTERIGISDNFFDLGGHSLLVAQAVLRMRQVFQADVPLRCIFERPTISELATLVDGLRRGAAPVAPDIRRVPREDWLPLSFAQERLWFLRQLLPHEVSYNVPAVVELEGALDPAALQQAVSECFRRHEPLRTIFPERDGQPFQRVLPHERVRVPLVDLTGLSAPARRDSSARLVQRDTSAPFDLARGPVARMLLLRLDPHVHRLTFTLHHVVSDGWSRQVLFRDLAELYSAAHDRRSDRTPPLVAQYVDYAAWQRTSLATRVLDEQLQHWRERLVGAPAALELPFDRPRPGVRSGEGGRVTLDLSPDLRDRMRSFCRAESATLFVTGLAALYAVLYRHSGQSDIVVGTPVLNRDVPELADAIGCFLNMLALRTEVHGRQRMRELLHQVREATIDAFVHRELPFERVVEELQPERHLGRHPLFQVVFTVVPPASRPSSFGDLRWRVTEPDVRAAKFDLTFAVTDTAERFGVTVEYSTDLFEVDTVERIARAWEHALWAMVRDPDVRVCDVPIATEAEHAAVLARGRGRRTDDPQGTVDERLERIACEAPDRVALTCGGESITFGRLRRRAREIQLVLLEHDVPAHARVGLLLPRCIDLIAAIWAVWRNGCAYVPLDPSHPAARLAQIATDAQPQLTLTDQSIGARMALPGLCVVVPPANAGRIARSLPAARRVSPDAAAYVMYTSGSTGTPKGVVVPSGGVVNLLSAMRDMMAFQPADRLLAVTTATFDISVLEMFLPLISGGAVTLATRDEIQDLDGLLRQMHTVSVVQATPSLWRAICDAGWQPSSPISVLCGGEALDPSLAARLTALTDRVWNVYGPTETTIWSMAYRLPPMPTRVLLGSPLANTQVYVVDRDGSLSRPGVPGELWIGGDGVAAGYWNRPDLTAEHFVPDLFSDAPGARAYRTGDRVRCTPDHELEFLGRCDQQVKIRGHRIECAEIEAALQQHPAIAAAVVIAKALPGGTELVGYVVFRGKAVPDTTLAEHVHQFLPDFMVPAYWVVIDHIPLTASGKVDRRALPDVARSSGAALEGPRTPLEEAILHAWHDVLGSAPIGVDDNFFALGGHSLRAMRMVAALQRVTGKQIHVRHVFECPTVRLLARRIESLSARTRPVEPIEADDVSSWPLSSAQARLWLVHRLEPESPAYHLAIRVRLRGPLDVDAWRRAIRALVDRHPMLRTVFEEAGGAPRQRILQIADSEPELVVRAFDHSTIEAREAAARRAASDEALQPFRFDRPPYRLALLRLQPGDHVFVACVHHILADALSLQILMRDMLELYAAELEHRRDTLPKLPVRYTDYARWQREELAGQDADELAYWTRQLDGVAPLELPTDRPRGATLSDVGDRVPLTIPREVAAALEDVSRAEGLTRFTGLLAAFQAFLSRYATQDDIAVGVPVANRTDESLAGVVGFFANTLVIRTRTSQELTFRALLRRVRQTCIDAFAHQQVPFETLVAELNPERQLSRHPLFQAMFQLLPASEHDLPSAGALAVSPFRTDHDSAKFDLNVFVYETAGGLAGEWEYSRDLFSRETAERAARHFCRFLAQAFGRPDAKLFELEWLDEREQALALDAHVEQRSLPEAAVVHTWFERQAALTPDAVAVALDEEAVSYRTLNLRADGVARYLRHLGVEPDDLIGICIARSVQMCAALLGILKAGAAYVPLDPRYPPDRLRFMIDDAGVQVILSDRASRAELPPTDARVILLDRDWRRISAAPPLSDPPALAADHLAYVLYTSGSTGTPKGVALHHRALWNLIDWHARTLVGGVRTLQFASLSFDASFHELFAAWATGGTAVIVADDVRGSARELIAFVEQTGVEKVILPVVVLQQIAELEQDRADPLPQLLEVTTTGEQLQITGPIRALFARTRNCHVIHNHYGPAETHVVTTYTQDGAPDEWPTYPPIGTSLVNTGAYLLDPRLGPVSLGATGELFLRGVQLARGYHRRPDLTADRFLPDPFAQAPGARMYRTGDLGRRGTDGVAVHLGRKDHQIKIRGMRVELGEVENAISRHPVVHEVVVCALPDDGSVRLVAYVVAAAAKTLTTAELRRYLQTSLPEHMIPSAVVSLDALPLTPNGKVDRRALPPPTDIRADAGGDLAEPASALAQLIAGLWARSLHVDRVGATDNFFQLGGHSMIGARMMAELSRIFQIDLPLRHLFQAPTVDELAERVVRAVGSADVCEEIAGTCLEVEQELSAAASQGV